MNNIDSGFEKGFDNDPQPFWIATTPETSYPELEEDMTIDVAIVGGGMVGITSAYLLKKEGLKVALIEADRIIKGTSGHTTAKITSLHNLIYNKVEKNMGKEKAQMYADSNEYAIKFMAELIKSKHIDCDFNWQPSYVYTEQDKYIQQIQDEVKTALELGIKASYLEEIPLPVKAKAAVRFEDQAQFHPRKYLLELVKDIPGEGSYIFEGTRIMDVKEGSPCTLITEKGKKITAENVILATHYPCYDGRGMYFSRLYPTRSYALGVRFSGNYLGGMYVTEEDPGRSVRSALYNGEEILVLSGEHHKTGQGENTINHYINMKKFAMDTFDIIDIPWRWSTHDYKTPDDVPYIGHLTSQTPNIYVATGFKKWGMTTSTVSAIIIKDLITTGKNQWADLYNPSRFVPSASTAQTYIKENANVAKHLIQGKLIIAPDKIDINKGEAKIVDIEGQKYGAYMDDKGKVHVVDTTCSHMGCELSWNAAEKSWDCPCHGSRYTYEGDIIEGPTVHRLKHLGDGKNEIDPNIF